MNLSKAPSNAVVQVRGGQYKGKNLMVLPSVASDTTASIHTQSLECGTVIVYSPQEQCRIVGTYEINVIRQKDFS